MSVKHCIKTGKMLKTAGSDRVADYVPETREVETTPIKAIRLMCIECMGNQMQHVRGCTAHTCPLFPYRMGDAHQKSEKQRFVMAERGKKSTFGKKTGMAMG